MNVSAVVRVTNAFLEALLNDALGNWAGGPGSGPLKPLYLALWTQCKGFNAGLDATGVTEATFNGYARKSLTFGGISLDNDGRVSAVAAGLSFTPTDTVVSEGVRGFALYDAATGGNLIAVGTFPAQFTFARPTDTLSVVVTISMPPVNLGDWGNAVAVR